MIIVRGRIMNTTCAVSVYNLNFASVQPHILPGPEACVPPTKSFLSPVWSKGEGGGWLAADRWKRCLTSTLLMQRTSVSEIHLFRVVVLC